MIQLPPVKGDTQMPPVSDRICISVGIERNPVTLILKSGCPSGETDPWLTTSAPGPAKLPVSAAKAFCAKPKTSNKGSTSNTSPLVLESQTFLYMRPPVTYNGAM